MQTKSDTSIMDITSILTLAVTFIAGGGGVFILNWLKTKSEQKRADKKQDNDIKLTETEKAFVMYKEILSSLKKDLENINKGYAALEAQYLEAREKNAILSSENTALRNQMTILKNNTKNDIDTPGIPK